VDLWHFYKITPSTHLVGKFVLEGLERYIDTQIKANYTLRN